MRQRIKNISVWSVVVGHYRDCPVVHPVTVVDCDIHPGSSLGSSVIPSRHDHGNFPRTRSFPRSLVIRYPIIILYREISKIQPDLYVKMHTDTREFLKKNSIRYSMNQSFY